MRKHAPFNRHSKKTYRRMGLSQFEFESSIRHTNRPPGTGHQPDAPCCDRRRVNRHGLFKSLYQRIRFLVSGRRLAMLNQSSLCHSMRSSLRRDSTLERWSHSSFYRQFQLITGALMTFKTAEQPLRDPSITSYDSGYEHSLEHLEHVQRLLAESDSQDASDYPSPADAGEKIQSQRTQKPALRSQRRSA